MTGNDRSGAVAKTKLRLVALVAGTPPYDRPYGPPPMLTRKLAAAAEAKRRADAVAVRKQVALTTKYAVQLVEMPASALSAAYPDAESWARAAQQIADAIEALQVVQSQLQRKVPK